MRVRKNGKVITLTESDLMRITRKVLKEQEESKNPKFSLMNLGMSGDQLENVLSKLTPGYNPKEDKFGTYLFLNPADFLSIDKVSEKIGSGMGKEYTKILDALVNAELLAKDPNDDMGGYMFGPKGKQNYQLYFKKPKKQKI